MKKLLFLILVLFTANVAFSQITTNVSLKCQIYASSGTAPTFNIQSLVSDELSKYDGSNVSAGDKLYVIEGSECYELHISSVSSGIGSTLNIVVYDSTGTLATVPNGQAAVIRKYSTQQVPFIPSGLRNDLASCILQKLASVIDNIGSDGNGIYSGSDTLSVGDTTVVTTLAGSALKVGNTIQSPTEITTIQDANHWGTYNGWDRASYSYGGFGGFYWFRGNGTAASKTALNVNDVMHEWAFLGQKSPTEDNYALIMKPTVDEITGGNNWGRLDFQGADFGTWLSLRRTGIRAGTSANYTTFPALRPTGSASFWQHNTDGTGQFVTPGAMTVTNPLGGSQTVQGTIDSLYQNSKYTAGSGIAISGGGVISATDNSVTNELQTLSLVGNDLTLSDGGGTIELPSGADGNGIYGGSGVVPLGTVARSDGSGPEFRGTTFPILLSSLNPNLNLIGFKRDTVEVTPVFYSGYTTLVTPRPRFGFFTNNTNADISFGPLVSSNQSFTINQNTSAYEFSGTLHKVVTDALGNSAVHAWSRPIGSNSFWQFNTNGTGEYKTPGAMTVTNPIGGANTLQAALDSLAIAGGADGNGIYGGNGIVPAGTVASLTDDFSITDGNAGFSVNTGDAMAEIFGANSFIQAGDSAVINSAGSDGALGQILIGSAGTGAAWGNAGTLPVTNPAGGANTLQAALDSLNSPRNLTFSNGLTKAGSAVKLGGNLTENTTIGAGAFNLTLSGSATNTLSASNSNAAGTVINAQATGGGLSISATSSGNGAGISVNTAGTGTGIQSFSTAGWGVVGVSQSETLPAGRFQNAPVSANTSIPVLDAVRNTSGTAASGIGAKIRTLIRTTSGEETASEIETVWTDATSASRTSRFSINTANNAIIERKFSIAGNGQLTFDKYGSGTFTGTAVKNLSVTASGFVIETDAPTIPIVGMYSFKRSAAYNYNAAVSPSTAVLFQAGIGTSASFSPTTIDSGSGIQVNFGATTPVVVSSYVTITTDANNYNLEIYVNGTPSGYFVPISAGVGGSTYGSAHISQVINCDNGDVVNVRLTSSGNNTVSIVNGSLIVQKL